MYIVSTCATLIYCIIKRDWKNSTNWKDIGFDDGLSSLSLLIYRSIENEIETLVHRPSTEGKKLFWNRNCIFMHLSMLPEVCQSYICKSIFLITIGKASNVRPKTECQTLTILLSKRWDVKKCKKTFSLKYWCIEMY